MRTIDFTPVFRSTVGFDRMARLMDDMLRAGDTGNVPAYPPYNIEKLGEDDYRITMAVAGFAEGDLDITVEDTTLVISGKVEKSERESDRSFLHRGIATRAFERRFHLAEAIKVVGASVENGLLHVDLVHEVPEEKKPRKIEIATAGATKRLEDRQAA
ncbi:MAG: Hsp20 family protein [Alphaproteobacteria bacterium]|nr:Hsp20 family protein [Alphaproteobacteria bacterium]